MSPLGRSLLVTVPYGPAKFQPKPVQLRCKELLWCRKNMLSEKGEMPAPPPPLPACGRDFRVQTGLASHPWTGPTHATNKDWSWHRLRWANNGACTGNIINFCSPYLGRGSNFPNPVSNIKFLSLIHKAVVLFTRCLSCFCARTGMTGSLLYHPGTNPETYKNEEKLAVECIHKMWMNIITATWKVVNLQQLPHVSL